METGTRATNKLLTDSFFQLYPHEAAQVLENEPVGEIVALLKKQTPATAAATLSQLNNDVAARCLERLSKDMAKSIFAELDPRVTAGLLAPLDETDREKKLSLLDDALAREIRELMTYPEGTAGHLMDPRVASFRASLTVDELLGQLQVLREQRIQTIFIIDSQGVLVGAVPLHDIILAEPDQKLEALITAMPQSITATSPRDEVVEMLSDYKLSGLPVVDFEGRLIGTIRRDAMVQAIQEEAAAGMGAMVGVSKEERALSSPLFVVRKRLGWLNINLLTAFLAAAVVGLFEGTIAKFTALAVLLPVVAGQSGNTGAQALAVTMRGLALREIRLRHWLRLVFKEAVAGGINGAAIGVVTGIGVFVWSRNYGLCLVIFISMVPSMAIAATSGALIPIILSRLGQDPAQASSIILTTITDVAGFLSFLGLATLLSGML